MRTACRPLAIVLIATAGCSLVAVDSPPARVRRGAPVTCTTQSAAPAADAIGAVAVAVPVLVLGILLSGSQGFDCDNDCPDNPITAAEVAGSVGAAALVSLPWSMSAWHGYSSLARCQKLVAEHAPRPVPTPTAAPAAAPPPPEPLPSEGQACKDPMPGVVNTGRCQKGLRCRGIICIRSR